MSEKVKMSFEELKQTQEYQRLTQKQKLFVATYCEGGLVDGNYDAVAATRTAYQCKSAEVARIMSYSLLQNIRIIRVLNLHFGTQPIDEFLTALDRAINNKKLTIAQLHALKLKCDVLGLGNKIPSNQSFTPPEPKKAKEPKPPKPAKKSKKAEHPVADSDYGF